MHKNQKGFSAVEGLIILVIVLLIGAAGWFVWQRNQDDNIESAATKTSQATTKNSSDEKLIEYKNASVHLSFKYPYDWSLNEDLSNPRQMGNEGTITLKSPDGLTLHINPDYGGKGGGCLENPADKPHNTENCSTLEVLSKEKIATKAKTEGEIDGPDIYLFRARYTAARENGKVPASEFGVFLSNNKYIIEASEPLVGAWFISGIIGSANEINITTFLETDNLTTAKSLQSNEVKQAEDVLRSLNII